LVCNRLLSCKSSYDSKRFRGIVTSGTGCSLLF
jgi:hypothetical protein